MKDNSMMNRSSIASKNYVSNGKGGVVEESQTLNLDKLKEKITYTFDYEVNNIKLDDNDDMNCKMYYYSPENKAYRILNYNAFNDRLRPVYKISPTQNAKKKQYNQSKFDKEFTEIDEPPLPKNVKSANIMKRLVSKQKRRYQDENFDLDMSYITNRVIAMGYPSIGCETVYRNSLTDVVNFFHKKHNDKVKIYNLCLEKDRIYNKNLFSKSSVGLFPATDHNPCPIKLILEFCIDICLYLLKNPNSVAAVHCKAGKGRTGVMICSYLVFSHLCESSEKAFRYYARIRTKDNTGVTIPSQKRYIKYFETFLQANFCPPYIFLIPKIIKSHFSHLMVGQGRLLVKNILQSFQNEKSYFISPNKFKLKGVRVGPLPKGKKITLKICNFINNNFKIKDDELLENESIQILDNNTAYYELSFNPELTIHSDIKITFQGVVSFYVWVNLWYSSWENIKKFYDKAELNVDEEEKKYNDQELQEIKNQRGIKEKEKELNNMIIKPKYTFEIHDTTSNNTRQINTNNNNYCINNELTIDEKKEDCSEHRIMEGNTDRDKIEKITSTKSLYEIIYKLKHNTDLNELINRINLDLKNKFDKKNMEIVLNSFEFDKFDEVSKYPDLKTTIYYSLVDK
jgi:phosphatidylinositol-3,4,5-trisphosphate 3-phosphatase/dual-specificity protein phosphatase PTEN